MQVPQAATLAMMLAAAITVDVASPLMTVVHLLRSMSCSQHTHILKPTLRPEPSFMLRLTQGAALQGHVGTTRQEAWQSPSLSGMPVCIPAAAISLLLCPHLGDHCAINEAVVSRASWQSICSTLHGRQGCLQDVDPVNRLCIHHTAAAGAGQVVSCRFACLSSMDNTDCIGCAMTARCSCRA